MGRFNPGDLSGLRSPHFSCRVGTTASKTPQKEQDMTTTTTGHNFQIGDFVQERLFTDTVVYSVVAATAKTITIQYATPTDEILRKEHRDGNQFPVIWEGVEANTSTPKKTLRLRKDGSFRAYQGGSPVRPATMIDGKPAKFVDYRY